MHQILTRLLNQKGIKNVTELSSDEKTDFDRWESILSDGEMTVEKIVVFCKNQLNIVENQWKNLDASTLKNERLIIAHTIYRALLDAIEGPKTNREFLESYLNQLLVDTHK